MTYIKKGSVIVAGKKKVVYKKKGSTKSYVIYKKRYMNIVNYKKLKSKPKTVKKTVKKSIKIGGWEYPKGLNPVKGVQNMLGLRTPSRDFTTTYTKPKQYYQQLSSFDISLNEHIENEKKQERKRKHEQDNIDFELEKSQIPKISEDNKLHSYISRMDDAYSRDKEYTRKKGTNPSVPYKPLDYYIEPKYNESLEKYDIRFGKIKKLKHLGYR